MVGRLSGQECEGGEAELRDIVQRVFGSQRRAIRWAKGRRGVMQREKGSLR